MRMVAVIDIGKTNAKVVLVDLATHSEIDVRRTTNEVRKDGLYPHFDVERLWAFILDSLTDFAAHHAIDGITVTTHGASGVLLAGDGELALPALDYEFDGPSRTAAAYDAIRPVFSETGSPRLTFGLNLGAQFHWQALTFPEQFARTGTMLTYPQYWGFRLSGVTANEVTSLGAHTDLWRPADSDYSTLVDAMGWRPLMAPLIPAGQRLGPIRADIAARTGLSPETGVFNGLHDSNASLITHVMARDTPFAVVSTGTWVISMAVGGRMAGLQPERDTLVNVNAFGQPVPSGRFMGGREFELLTAKGGVDYTDADITSVIESQLMLLPAVVPDCGPFFGRAAHWTSGAEPEPGLRNAAASLYLAGVTATSLELIDASGDIVVEGPFARNTGFVSALASFTGRPVTIDPDHATGTSIGAALLASGGRPPPPSPSARRIAPSPFLAAYANAWRTAAEAHRGHLQN